MGGAVLVDGTVRRAAGPWTPAVHALLRFLESAEFEGAPRALGIDAQGREILSYLPGETVGDRRPWPEWVHSDEALVEVGKWLRRYHDVVADFEPLAGAEWRMTPAVELSPGDVIGHNDAAPYNAVWSGAVDANPPPRVDAPRLIGFIDWDFAAPCPAIWDLAFVASAWVPLHARDVAASEGFTDFDDRPRRLRLLLESYRYDGTTRALLETVSARMVDHIRGIEKLACAGDLASQRLLDDGVITRIERAIAEFGKDAPTYEEIA
jgi:Phosphotransferase enzyme family